MPRISVIFASRGRPDGLLEALNSLISKAISPSDMEIIVAVDPDDIATLNLAQDGDLPASTRLWTAPERFGYNRLHDYLNGLAVQATGEWLMWFNDDMRMQTHGWDDVITSNRPAVTWPHANHVQHANIAPAWPKKWSDATGHASPSSHMDTYWQRVGEALGRHDQVPVDILHDRADVTGGNDDQTYAEGRKILGSEGMVPGFDSYAFHQDVDTDVSVIRRLL